MQFSKKLDKLLKENSIKNLRQLATELDIPYTTLWDYYSNPIRLEKANLAYIKKIAKRLNCTVDYLVYEDTINTLNFDNAELVDINTDTVQIPVLGVIKAGTPIEAQEDILEYVEIPKEWTKGGKSFYGLKINGDSMYPKYQTDDIVIFEKNEDIIEADNHDCAILVNGFDATFKKFKLNQNGITLIPYNQENSDGFETTYYDSQQVQDLPIKIIGIAREKRTRL